jgi:hypothetical protein
MHISLIATAEMSARSQATGDCGVRPNPDVLVRPVDNGRTSLVSATAYESATGRWSVRNSEPYGRRSHAYQFPIDGLPRVARFLLRVRLDRSAGFCCAGSRLRGNPHRSPLAWGEGAGLSCIRDSALCRDRIHLRGTVLSSACLHSGPLPMGDGDHHGQRRTA